MSSSGVVGPSCRPDALVHLTAVPAPGIVPDHLTFMNNIACSWNVVSAGGALMGVLTVVAAAEEVLVKGTQMTRAAALVLLAARGPGGDRVAPARPA
jgi:hypothetical protein